MCRDVHSRFKLNAKRTETTVSVPCLLWGYFSIARHQSRHFLNALQRERRQAERLHGDGHQLHGIIVSGYPVGAQLPAAAAAMDDRPFAVFPDPHRHWIHQSTAVRFAIAGLHVHVEADEAVGTVVAMIASRALRNDGTSAVFADKAVAARMCFVIACFIFFSFVFAVHFYILLNTKKITNFSNLCQDNKKDNSPKR